MALDSTKPTLQQTYGDATRSTRENFEDYAAHKGDGSAHGLDSISGRLSAVEAELGGARGNWPTLDARNDTQDGDIASLRNRLIAAETYLEQHSDFDADNPILINPNTITTNTAIAAGNNATSAGPITIADSVTVDVGDGANWTIV